MDGQRLATDEPVVLSCPVTIGKQQIAVTETSHSHIEVYLAEEFRSLIDKRVQCNGSIKSSSNFFADEIIFDVDTALDCKRSVHHSKAVFYEPEKVELSGMLYEVVYPGPPEYTSVEMY